MRTVSGFTIAAMASVLAAASCGLGQVAEGGLAFPTNEQLRHFKAMGGPRLSPDGKQVLVRIADATADGAKGHIWLVDVGGGPARQLTFSPEADKGGERGAQWMPDGSAVLFLAHRDEHTRLYRLPMAGGEAKAYELKVPVLVDESKLPGALPTPAVEEAKEKKAGEKTEAVGDDVAIDVENFRIAPDGKTIALLLDDPETPGRRSRKRPRRTRSGSTMGCIDRGCI